MRCKYCGEKDDEANMSKVVRMKDGNIVINKRTKKPLYDYYHTKCKTHSDNVNYLKCFVSMISGPDKPFPTRVLRDLKPYWEAYGYEMLISYLKSIENYLLNAKCSSYSHRMNLLVYMVKNNIDEFVSNNSTPENSLLEHDVNFITRKPVNTFNDENYDLLD